MPQILDFNNALREKELEAFLANPSAPDRDKVLSGLTNACEQFVAWLFPNAIVTPRNARVGNIHGSPGTSLVIETRGSKRGVWADFADPTQKGGNLIDLYMAARGLPFAQALNELADWVGHGSRPEVNYQREQAVRKLKKVERDLGPQKGEWHYTDADGMIVATVYRFEPEPGHKEFLPWDAIKRRYGNPDIRPLYNIPGILKAQSVVMCEGEKAAQALIDRGIAATCVMGGSNSPLDRTDFAPLTGKKVTIWPDNDEPGRKFGAAIAGALRGIVSELDFIDPPADAPKGWDAADEQDPSVYLGAPSSAAKPVLPFVWFRDARPNLEANDFVEGLLTSGSMSVIYGPSNCGKTFFVLDLALHVAWGREWRGKIVDRGAVVYLSLEGAQGVQNRMNAFRSHHDCGDLPFVAMPKPVNLLDDKADVEAVIQLVEYIAQETALPVRMVIVDTLSRAMAGGNENSSEDMTALIGNCDRVRHATGAHVCIIHHSGKDEARGARGHSSLRAATDTEIEIKRDPEVTRSIVKVVKQRDLEADEPLAFTLKSVNLGTNKRGKPVTSCVVLDTGEGIALGRFQGLSGKEREALEVLCELTEARSIDPETGEISLVPVAICSGDWKDALGTSGTISRDNLETSRRQFNRLRTSLENKGKIAMTTTHVTLAGTSRDKAGQ
jgi:hypothetical protein